MRRRVRVWKMEGRWWWECTLCQPAFYGSTFAFEKTIRNVARHCRHQSQHHRYVRTHR